MTDFSERLTHEIWTAIEKQTNIRLDDKQWWQPVNSDVNIDLSFHFESFVFTFYDIDGNEHQFILSMSYDENTSELIIHTIGKL